MIMDKKLLKILQKSYDGQLSPAEKELLENALKTDPALQKEKRETDQLRKVISSANFSFEPGFSERVMSKLENDVPADTHLSNPFVYAFYRIALPGLVAAVILFLFTVFSSGTLSPESLMGIDRLQSDYFSEMLLFNY